MLPDRVSNPGLLTYESGALPIALRGPAHRTCNYTSESFCICSKREEWNLSAVVNIMAYVLLNRSRRNNQMFDLKIQNEITAKPYA